jgi:hypothetical protein
MENTIHLYEQELLVARQHFSDRFDNLLSSLSREVQCMNFLMNYCSYGVGMTEYVPHWIRRAGKKCQQLNFTPLGADLIRHADQEAGHHEMMRQDTRTLCAFWHEKTGTAVNADSLLNRVSIASVQRYQALHEDVISSEHPYAQIAIEYEIEMLSAIYGKQLIKKCIAVLGHGVTACLSFVDDHVALDVGHTAYNKRVMTAFLAEHPSTVSHLSCAGKNALAAYGDFLRDCTVLPDNFFQ